MARKGTSLGGYKSGKAVGGSRVRKPRGPKGAIRSVPETYLGSGRRKKRGKRRH